MTYRSGQKTINQHRQSVPAPIRRSRRLNKSLPLESPPRENVQTPNPSPVKPIKRHKSILLPTPNPSPEATPTTPFIMESFKKTFEDIENSSSFSGDIKKVAYQVPSYRYVERIKKLARRLYL